MKILLKESFLYYLFTKDTLANDINAHFTQQYIAGEEEYVANYIYLENFNQEIKELEKCFELKPAPINEFSTSWHHQPPAMIYKGNFSDADITILYSLAIRLLKAFMIMNVYSSSKQYFKKTSIHIDITKNIHTDFNLLSLLTIKKDTSYIYKVSF